MGFLNMGNGAGWEYYGMRVKQGVFAYDMSNVKTMVLEADKNGRNPSYVFQSGQSSQLSQYIPQNQLRNQTYSFGWTNYAQQMGQVWANQIVQTKQAIGRSDLTQDVVLATPILSPITMAPDNLRVPLYHDDVEDFYIIWTGEGALRRLTAETLPDFVKAKLGMINSCLETQEYAQLDKKYIDHLDVFILTEIKRLQDLGWRCSKYYYCLIMTEAELDEVKGVQVEGIT